jgi:hypothetical protein
VLKMPEQTPQPADQPQDRQTPRRPERRLGKRGWGTVAALGAVLVGATVYAGVRNPGASDEHRGPEATSQTHHAKTEAEVPGNTTAEKVKNLSVEDASIAMQAAANLAAAHGGETTYSGRAYGNADIGEAPLPENGPAVSITTNQEAHTVNLQYRQVNGGAIAGGFDMVMELDRDFGGALMAQGPSPETVRQVIDPADVQSLTLVNLDAGDQVPLLRVSGKPTNEVNALDRNDDAASFNGAVHAWSFVGDQLNAAGANPEDTDPLMAA